MWLCWSLLEPWLIISNWHLSASFSVITFMIDLWGASLSVIWKREKLHRKQNKFISTIDRRLPIGFVHQGDITLRIINSLTLYWVLESSLVLHSVKSRGVLHAWFINLFERIICFVSHSYLYYMDVTRSALNNQLTGYIVEYSCIQLSFVTQG